MMKHKVMLTCCLAGAILLTGCKQDGGDEVETMVETQALETGDYGATLPFSSSDSRQQHATNSRSLIDSMYIGTGLLQYAKGYFSPSAYTIQEGQFLEYYELKSLLGRETDENPDGLNPSSTTEFDTGNGVVTAPVLVRDIYEVDFLKNKEMKGLALGVAFYTQVGKTESEQTTTIEDSKLNAYAQETARKLVTYLRKMPEIGDDMPIYVALYKDNAKDQNLPGVYFSEAFFEGRSSNFSEINEQWVLVPSDEMTKLDGSVATQFTQVKNAIHGFLPDDVSLIGKGKFQNGNLKELRINVDMYAKTATEALSLTQYLKAQLSTFSSLEYKITVEVRCQDITIATMVRALGEKSVNVNTLL